MFSATAVRPVPTSPVLGVRVLCHCSTPSPDLARPMCPCSLSLQYAKSRPRPSYVSMFSVTAVRQVPTSPVLCVHVLCHSSTPSPDLARPMCPCSLSLQYAQSRPRPSYVSMFSVTTVRQVPTSPVLGVVVLCHCSTPSPDLARPRCPCSLSLQYPQSRPRPA